MREYALILTLIGLSLPASALAELRTYSVDPQYRQEVYSALDGVLRNRPQPVGRIERLPTGQFLVDTSPELHRQIEAILDSIAAQQPTAAPQIGLRYWAVLGSRNAEDDANLPAVLSGTLDELEAIHGELGFRILGTARLVTESGQSGVLNGAPLLIEQEAYAQGDSLSAQIVIQFRYPAAPPPWASSQGPNAFQTVQYETQTVDLRTTLVAGETLVLSESTIDGAELEGILFYIVYWPEEG